MLRMDLSVEMRAEQASVVDIGVEQELGFVSCEVGPFEETRNNGAARGPLSRLSRSDSAW